MSAYSTSTVTDVVVYDSSRGIIIAPIPSENIYFSFPNATCIEVTNIFKYLDLNKNGNTENYTYATAGNYQFEVLNNCGEDVTYSFAYDGNNDSSSDNNMNGGFIAILALLSVIVVSIIYLFYTRNAEKKSALSESINNV